MNRNGEAPEETWNLNAQAIQHLTDFFRQYAGSTFDQTHSSAIAYFQGQYHYIFAYPNDPERYFSCGPCDQEVFIHQDFKKLSHPQRDLLLALYSQILSLLNNEKILSELKKSFSSKIEVQKELVQAMIQ
jgi:hypothetical protein